MQNITTQTLLDVPPKFILEIASGVREPSEVAEEYGYSPEQWEDLKILEPFVKLVDTKKAELKATGWTFRLKSAMAAEDILEDVYVAAKDQGASFHTKLESLKFFARAAGIDAPNKDEEQVGNKFSITINLGGGEMVQVGINPGRTKAPERLVREAKTLPEEEYTEFTAETDVTGYDSTYLFADYTPVDIFSNDH